MMAVHGFRAALAIAFVPPASFIKTEICQAFLVADALDAVQPVPCPKSGLNPESTDIVFGLSSRQTQDELAKSIAVSTQTSAVIAASWTMVLENTKAAVVQAATTSAAFVSDNAEMWAASATALGYKNHVWLAVYLVKGLIDTLIARGDKTLANVFWRLADAIAKDHAFGIAACTELTRLLRRKVVGNVTSDEKEQKRRAWHCAECIGSVFTVLLSKYATSELASPVFSICSDVIAVYESIWTHGVRGNDVWRFCFILIRAEVFLAAGPTIGFLIDQSMLKLDERVKALVQHIYSSLEAAFTYNWRDKIMKQLSNKQLAGEECIRRVSNLALKDDGGLVFDLPEQMLVDVDAAIFQQQQSDVITTLGAALCSKPTGLQYELAWYLYAATSLLRDDRSHGLNLSQIYLYQDLVVRYGRWFTALKDEVRQNLGDARYNDMTLGPDSGNICDLPESADQDLERMKATLCGIAEDTSDCPYDPAVNLAPRCRLACTAAMSVCSSSAYASPEVEAGEWKLPGFPAWCFKPAPD